MNCSRLVFAGVGVALVLLASPFAADTDALKTLVRITMNLNHHPSDEDKAALAALVTE